MSIKHNRIKVADLEKNQPNKILTTSSTGELEFRDIYNVLDCTVTGKVLDARQGKILQESKVDKATGKSLVSDTEINRLGTLSNYVHPDNHSASIITQDTNNRFVTDAEKTTWNAKQSSLGFTAENVANKNVASGYAGLGADGKLISSQLPSITISDTFVTASQAMMLALTAETGDVAVRTDLSKSFILKGTNPTVLSDWQELLTPTTITNAFTATYLKGGAIPSVTSGTDLNTVSTGIIGNYGSGSYWLNSPALYGMVETVDGYNGAGISQQTLYDIRHNQSIYADIWNRQKNSLGWTGWSKMLHSNNYNNYVPTLTGSGASGTWDININGNASHWGGRNADLNTINNSFDYALVRNPDGTARLSEPIGFKSWLGLGSNAYTSISYLPLTGGIMTGGISMPSNGSTWISGKTSTLTLTGFPLSSGSYHPLIRQNTYSGNVINLGGLGDNWGFYGYYAATTANQTDWQCIFNSTTGDLSHSRNFSALAFYSSVNSSYNWLPNTSGSHRFNTPSGYVEIGPKNTGWCHFETDKPRFYMGTSLSVNGDIQRYNDGATYLHSSNIKSFAVLHQDGARYATDFNTILTSGFYNAEGTPANSPGGSYGQLIAAKGIDTGLQIYGGYFNDQLWFRGWGNSGGSFSSWRKVLHDGNINTNTSVVAGSRFITNAFDSGQADSFSCSNWFRSGNTTGWYNQTYGGGIWMQNTTNVEIYGNKQFLVNNNILATGDIIAYYSDERLKTRKGNITNAIDKVKTLTGFYYENNDLAKSFGYESTDLQLGLSAQEVQTILPEVVVMAPFDRQVLEDGTEVSKSGEDYLTVNYAKLVPLLVQAIKEQQIQIDELNKKINT
jgi:hypothetical protein